MDVFFVTTKLEKEFCSARALRRNRGTIQAKLIQRRMSMLAAAQVLEDLRNAPGRFHELKGDKAGRLACDLDGPYRLLFEPEHHPLPKLPTGGLDWAKVTSVRILDVENYHD